jgi:hypothetical protein
MDVDVKVCSCRLKEDCELFTLYASAEERDSIVFGVAEDVKGGGEDDPNLIVSTEESTDEARLDIVKEEASESVRSLLKMADFVCLKGFDIDDDEGL